jgi:hypothetical protein
VEVFLALKASQGKPEFFLTTLDGIIYDLNPKNLHPLGLFGSHVT